MPQNLQDPKVLSCFQKQFLNPICVWFFASETLGVASQSKLAFKSNAMFE